MKRIPRRALAGLLSQPWAIQPEWLRSIVAVVQRDGLDIEALSARVGARLDRTQTATLRDGIAIVPVVGPILPRANILTEISGATSLDILARDLSEADKSPTVRHIIMDMDTPGGVVPDELAAMVAGLATPVTAFVGGVCASAGVWIAAASDRIMANKTALIGSVGVVATVSVQEEPDQNGERDIEIVSTNAPEKRPDPTTDEGRDSIRAVIDELEALFVADLAAFRGVTVETVLSDFGQGGLLIAEQARQAGMIDGIGTFEEVFAEISADNQQGRMVRPALTNRSTATMAKLTAAELTAQHPESAAELHAAGKSEGLEAGKAEGLAAGKAAGTEAGKAEGYEIGKAEGLAAGAQAERDRIAGLKANGLPGYESLLEACIGDGKSNGADLAQKIIAAQREKGGAHVAAIKSDAEAVEKAGGLPSPVSGDGDPEKPKQVADFGQAKKLADGAKRLMAEAKARGEHLSNAEAVEQVRASLT